MEIHRNAYIRTFNPFVVGSTPAGPTKFKPRKPCAYGVFCYADLGSMANMHVDTNLRSCLILVDFGCQIY